jgi:hypothetical protein
METMSEQPHEEWAAAEALGKMNERQNIVEGLLTHPQKKALNRTFDTLFYILENEECDFDDVRGAYESLVNFFPHTIREHCQKVEEIN